MAVNTNSDKPNLTTPIAIIAAIAALIFLIWWGYKNFGPDRPPPTTAANANTAWLDKIAKETGGDASKLSPEDMGKLQNQTQGHAAIALKGYAKEHGFAH